MNYIWKNFAQDECRVCSLQSKNDIVCEHRSTVFKCLRGIQEIFASKDKRKLSLRNKWWAFQKNIFFLSMPETFQTTLVLWTLKMCTVIVHNGQNQFSGSLGKRTSNRKCAWWSIIYFKPFAVALSLYITCFGGWE